MAQSTDLILEQLIINQMPRSVYNAKKAAGELDPEQVYLPDTAYDDSLGVTDAVPGKTIKVKAVQGGKPTEWETADIYEKPADGIPKTDLAGDVQTSLAKADTAISYNSQTLTEEQKSQARTNIGAVDENLGFNKYNIHVTTTSGTTKDFTYYTNEGEIRQPTEAVDSSIRTAFLGLTLWPSAKGISENLAKTLSKQYKILYDANYIDSPCRIIKSPLESGDNVLLSYHSSDNTVQVSGNWTDGYYNIIYDVANDALTHFYVSNNISAVNGAVNQLVMSAAPTEDMHIATKQYVDTAKAEGQQLGLTAATPGQIIKVKTVQDGKPTEWEAVDDRLPKVSASDTGNVLGVEQIGEFEYGYALTHMPTLSDFIPLGITNASPGQFAKVSFVDDFGGPTAWEAADIYEKPTSGIPKSDLEQSVQISLAKADTAISYDSQTLTEEQQKQARTNIGAGQPVFAVNLTEVEIDNYTADKTAAEIEAAYQAGRTIVCRMQGPFMGTYIPVELPLLSRLQERVFYFGAEQLSSQSSGKRLDRLSVQISDSGVNVSADVARIYEKSDYGIPKSDLAQSVQDALDRTWNNMEGKPFSEIGEGLKVDGGKLTVDTTDKIEQGNIKPVTSAAVYTEIGNINALLQNSKSALKTAIEGKGVTVPDDAPLSAYPALVDAISTADNIQHADVPTYVKAEALAVAEKVKAVLQDDSIVFVAVSDFHHPGEQQDAWQTNINTGDLHACQALKILAYSLPRIDFACMLGDVTFGNANTTTALMQQQFDEINGWLGESWKNIPQFRTVGNHDTGEYSTLVGAQFLRNNITKYNAGAVYGSDEYGYCYRDFPDRKLRVICLNSCEGETISGNNAAYCFSPAQLLWFAQTLYDVGSKADAAQWGVMVLAHYPLDLGGAYPAGNVAKAYVAGESTTQNGVTVNFNGHNAAKFIMNVHGHNHCFQYGKLHSIVNGQATEFDAWRMCTPNACFYRNNSGVVTMNGISFGDPAPYDKTAGTGKDTAFNVNVINLSEQVLYSFCYGAGIDRTIGYAATVYHSITNTLTKVTNSNSAVAAEDGTAYSATITAEAGYTMSSVTITMGGTDITATAYNADTGVISIAAVTGDVVITAKATKVVSYHNLVPTAVDSNGASAPYTDGMKLDSDGSTSAYNHFVVTGFIPFDGGANHTYRIGGEGITWNEYGAIIAWYNADFTLHSHVIKYDKIGYSQFWPTPIEESNTAITFSTDANVAPPQGAAYFRVSAKGKGENLIITLDEKIE